MHDLIESLKQLNLQLRAQLELAEAQIPQLNELLARVASIGLADNLVLLGSILCDRPYDPGKGPPDSSQLVQAALVMPAGLGVVLWDSQEFLGIREVPSEQSHLARLKFFPFEELEPAVQAMLLLQARVLLERACDLLRPLEPGISPVS